MEVLVPWGVHSTQSSQPGPKKQDQMDTIVIIISCNAFSIIQLMN